MEKETVFLNPNTLEKDENGKKYEIIYLGKNVIISAAEKVDEEVAEEETT